MKYEIGVMISKIELEADNIDEAQCIWMVYFQTNAPIAVYNSTEKSSVSFAHKIEKVEKILNEIWKKKNKKNIFYN